MVQWFNVELLLRTIQISSSKENVLLCDLSYVLLELNDQIRSTTLLWCPIQYKDKRNTSETLSMFSITLICLI